MSAAPPEPGLSADELLRLSPIWVGLDAALCVQARSPAADLLLGAPAPGTALNTSPSLRRPAGAETAARPCAHRGTVPALAPQHILRLPQPFTCRTLVDAY